jgi:hypothetical protein
MIVAQELPYGTAHRDYVATLEADERHRAELADRAWEFASAVEEEREDDRDVVCFFELDHDDQTTRSALQAYLYELGYDSTISQKKHSAGWLMRIGPPKRPRRFWQRPRVMEHIARNG